MACLRRILLSIVSLFFLGNLFAQTPKYGFVRADTVEVLKNALQLKYPWVGGLNSPQFSTIDLDMDGIEDLFIFDREGNKILTFINEGAPGNNYRYAPEYEKLFPVLQSWVLLRDFDNDGKKDIFSYYPGGIMVHKNISTPGNMAFQQITNPFIYSLHPPNNNPINLYASSIDIPAIDDIDGDGDLDVVTIYFFTSGGEPRVVYHKNLSMEQTGTPDTLLFELRNECWGHFKEDFTATTHLKFKLQDTCSNIYITNPESAPYSGGTYKHDDAELILPTDGLRHTSGCVLTFDYNGDGVKDMLFGDSDFRNMVLLENDNKGVNMYTSFISQDTVFPNNTIPINIAAYPCAYYEDFDNDGVKDIIASPNLNFMSENEHSVWYYKNYGTNSSPVLIRNKTNLFQENMLEFGSGARPVFVDYNGDGLMDIVVGNYGYFNSSNSTYESKLALLVNIGTAQQPMYDLINTDFAGLFALSLGANLNPAFGDLDGDGDLDMIVGNFDGYLHYFENTAGLGNPAVYTLVESFLKDNTNTTIDVGQEASPILFDVDGDGDLDMVVGNRNGVLYYIENRGNSTQAAWDIVTTAWGGVDVSEWWTSQGSSSPWIFKNDLGEMQLFVGSERGFIFHYNDIESNIMGGNFNKVDTTVAGINIGPKGKPTLADINGNGQLELVVGTQRGGLGFFVSDSVNVSSIGENILHWAINIYPNPTENQITVEMEHIKNGKFLIHDITGRTMQTGLLNGRKTIIDLEPYSQGIYLITFTDGFASKTYKIIRK